MSAVNNYLCSRDLSLHWRRHLAAQHAVFSSEQLFYVEADLVKHIMSREVISPWQRLAICLRYVTIHEYYVNQLFYLMQKYLHIPESCASN